MGKINTTKMEYSHEYYTTTQESNIKMNELYGKKTKATKLPKKLKTTVCTLRPTPIRSK